jgi:hypothetical protein
LRLQPCLLHHAFRCSAILDQEAGELLGRAQDRLERAIDELLLAERGITADPGDILADLGDDPLRRAGCASAQARAPMFDAPPGRFSTTTA